MSAKIDVTATSAESGIASGLDVVLLPIADDNGTPVYPDVVPELLSELGALGVRAGMRHPADEAEFRSSRGPVTEILLQIGVGIGSAAGWGALKAILGRRTGTIKVVALYEQGDKRCRAEVTGKPAEVAEALEQINPFGPEDDA